ncbi:transcription antitermination factor NusB [Candidatus Saccharibacteria bacterium]|nr:transcription antitermination factor NusB [Candidatus Saccharibacteria bacterium]
MASNRHLGRIISLQSLYEYEFRIKAGDATADIDTIIAKNIEPYEKALGDTEFVYNLARNVAEKFKPLDEDLKPLAPEWPISSIAAIDRNILRMGLYELKFCADSVPPKVAINEAVELAKAFGSDNSSRFINGVLGTAFRQIDPEAATKDKNEGSKKEQPSETGSQSGTNKESESSAKEAAPKAEPEATASSESATAEPAESAESSQKSADSGNDSKKDV